MTRTTDDWAALLDGTTPAPWGWEWDQGILAITGASGEAVAIDADIRDSDVLAASPEAVAEVIRLREKLEEHIRVWLIVADKLEARGLASEADVTRIHTTELTSILNGDTNE